MTPSRSTLRKRRQRYNRSHGKQKHDSPSAAHVHPLTTDPKPRPIPPVRNRCKYWYYGCNAQILQQDNHEEQCSYLVRGVFHEIFCHPEYRAVGGWDSWAEPFRIPELEFWQGQSRDVHLGEVYEGVLRPRRTNGDIHIAGESFGWPKLGIQMFIDYPPHDVVYAINIPPPKCLKESFIIPRVIKENRLVTLLAHGTVNATPRHTFVDFHIDRGMATVSVPLEDIADRGRKVWALFPPTQHNRAAYHNVSRRPDGERYSGIGQLEGGRIAITERGWGLYIPAGWIHCVYTISSGLLVGSNFTTPDSMDEFAQAVVDEAISNKHDKDFASSVGVFAESIQDALNDGSMTASRKGAECLLRLYDKAIIGRLTKLAKWPEQVKALLTSLAVGEIDTEEPKFCLCGSSLSVVHVKKSH